MDGLRHAFAPKKADHQIYREIFEEQQNQSSTDVFINKKRMLFAELGSPLTEKAKLDMTYGLLHRRITQRVTRESITNLHELLIRAREVEADFQVSTGSNNQEANKRRRSNEGGNEEICGFCRKKGHSRSTCWKKRNAQQEPAMPRPKQEFRKVNPPRPQTQPRSQAPPKGQLTFKDGTTLRCYGCNRPGTIRSKCPICTPTNITAPPPTINFWAMEGELKTYNRAIVKVKIGQDHGLAYLDTGAEASIASQQLYRRLRRQGYHFKTRLQAYTLADGVCQTRTVQTVRAIVELQDRLTPINFLVLPGEGNNKTLLGADYLHEAGIVINLPQEAWSFVDIPDQYHNFLKEEQARDILKTRMDLEEELQGTKHTFHCDDATPPEVKTAPVQQEGKPETPFRYSSLVRDMMAGSGIGREHIYDQLQRTAIYSDILFPHRPMDGTSGISATSTKINALTRGESIAEPATVELRDDEGPDLTAAQRTKVNDLLNQCKPAFSKVITVTPKILHRINTSTHGPIAVPPYRLSPIRQSELRKEIDKMLEQHIIEESDSPWAAPVVMVPKTDGSYRICIDYRKLNAVTVPDVYPLPRIDDLLHTAGRTRYMSTIDLRAGYWQIAVQKEDLDKTAFITPFGLYRFNRMSFGLRNAPATFQRLIDRFKIELNEVNVLAYLDDIIVLSATMEDHCEDLQRVFQKLHDYNLKANREKCHFFCSEVQYLGHLITPKGISTNPQKIEAIVAMKEPANVKQVQTFLQTCSWYRRFIPQFAKVAKPLSDLTKKKATWKWEEAEQSAYTTLKKLLTSAPILRQADPERKFVVKTDASGWALGAVLVQGEGAEEHPVEYASRLLTSAERNYSTTEREALAVVWAMNKFRGYVEGADITIITDHQALRWLMTIKSPTGRLARWALQLQPYNLTIKYTPGKTNVVADTLSRPPGGEVIAVAAVALDFPSRGAADIRQEQLKDEGLKKIVGCFEAHNQTEDVSYWTNKGYLMMNGILHRYSPESEEEEAQLVVPEHEWPEIMKIYHDAPMAGHYGADRTIRRISRRYFWRNMRAYITNYVKRCLECQRYKIANLKPAGLLQTTVMNQRFEIIAFDLFGPLPKSDDNKVWVFVVEDIASRWVELFSLEQATAAECASVLIDEILIPSIRDSTASDQRQRDPICQRGDATSDLLFGHSTILHTLLPPGKQPGGAEE
jgi:hypothetical protein